MEVKNLWTCTECGRKTDDPDSIVDERKMLCVCAECNGNEGKVYDGGTKFNYNCTGCKQYYIGACDGSYEPEQSGDNPYGGVPKCFDGGDE